MTLLLIPYIVCAAAYVILLGLLLARRTTSRVGRVFFLACLATLTWALVAAIQLSATAVMVASSLSTTMWLLFVCVLASSRDAQDKPFWRRGGLASIAPLIGLLTMGVAASRLIVGPDYSVMWGQFQLIGRLITAVLGISLIENFYRNSASGQRWAISPLCIGLGSTFAFDLYLFSDALLFRHIAPALMAAGAVIDALAVPLLALSMARSESWRVPARISRDAAFHGVTLMTSGIFLISAAVIGGFVRRYGGEWTLVLQVSLLFGSAIVLVVVLSSDTAKSYVMNIVLKNFFPYRYDYRVEWMKFIETLSSNDDSIDLPQRVIRSIADIVNSPGGALFQQRDHIYLPTACWNVRVMSTAREPDNSAFIAGFDGSDGVRQFQVISSTSESSRPTWIANDRFWLAVPLIHRDELIGFVVLSNPRAPFDLDWEVTDLMRIAAHQAASYLAEQDATAALTDAQQLEEYSKRFAFVVHDIKNLSNQLSLIISNARLHGDDPQFRADLMLTIESSVGRLNRLLSQLKVRQASAMLSITDVSAAIDELVSTHPARARLRTTYTAEHCSARIETGSLSSALTHLIENALQASGDTREVSIEARTQGDQIIIDISDRGPGMEMSFIRDRLFRPFNTTKDHGYGIGAFQTRELIRSAGGKLDVLSTPGIGTTMRIILAAVKPIPTPSVV